jgi:glycosyltransferase involved in cell wall biosynthesis
MLKLPFFSIIVPTYKRPNPLRMCLEALARLDYPRQHFEVIVVDDGSPIPPKAVVAHFDSQLDLTLLTQPNAGPAAARNAGASQAKGEFLAFTDDDCTPAPDWLRSLAFRLEPATAVGGCTRNAFPDNLYSSASQMLIDYFYRCKNPVLHDANFLASNNMALSKAQFLAIGGFDTTFRSAGGEDREFCERFLRAGLQMVYIPEAVVYHKRLLTFRTFWWQHFNYGRGSSHFRRINRLRKQERIHLEPISFYWNLLRYPLSQTSGWRAFQLVALQLVSQIATVGGFIWEREQVF